MNQLFAAYAMEKRLKKLAIILGDAALTDIDSCMPGLLMNLKQNMYPKVLTATGHRDHTGYRLETLSILPVSELKRIDQKYIDKYMPR